MKLFKNKLFLMLFAYLFVVCLFNSNCFASFDFTYDNTEYSLPDLPDPHSSSDKFFIVRSLSNTNYFQVCFVFYNYSQTNGEPYTIDDFKIYVDSSNYVKCKLHLLENNSWVNGSCDVYSTLVSGSHWSSNGGSLNLDDYIFVYSTADIYESENSDTVVFQGASQPTETNQVVLAEIVEQQETNKVMEEILGILPIVIVVIVSLIAIRKAIAFLVTLLHRS